MSNRRRRYNTDAADEHIIVKEQAKFKVKFAEQLDYKMEIDDGQTKPRQTKIINQDPTQVQKRQAFKKKLRKFSNMLAEGTYMELQ